jgi:ketosteroid isomerase-like protein
MKSLVLFAVTFASSLVFAQGSFPPEPTSLQHEIVVKEREELNCLKNSDVQCFADLIADNAVFLDPHGAATKQEVVSHITGLKLTDFTMADVRYVPLGARTGLIAYTLTEKGNANGQNFSKKMFVSAVWAERDGKWLCLFSQETPARAAPAM